MFEKVAEEIAKDIYIEVLKAITVGVQKGAGFGYNKANEWHYVKDGLPKTSGRYLVYTGGEPFILDFDTEINSFGYWVVSLEDDWGVREEDFETVKDRGEMKLLLGKKLSFQRRNRKCVNLHQKKRN